MQLPAIDSAFLLDFLQKLLETPSPTGYCQDGIDYIQQTLQPMLSQPARVVRKGGLLVTLPGEKTGHARAVTAHVDTLGAMVKEIKPNGRLRLNRLGGYAWNTVEGEGCRVKTSTGKLIRGSILIENASVHVFGDKVSESRREDANMEVRLDERTTNETETRALGIEVGDFVFLDPRVEINNNFVRSRHLDDKSGVACMVAAFKALNDAGLNPPTPVTDFSQITKKPGMAALQVYQRILMNCWSWIWLQLVQARIRMNFMPPCV